MVEMAVIQAQAQKPAWRWAAITCVAIWAQVAIVTAPSTEVRVGHRLAQTSPEL
jgi:hypothetical protein